MSEAGNEPQPGQPFYPTPLSSELADFLTQQGPYACLSQATDHGTVLVVKAPADDIRSVQGTVPIEVRHELYYHPASPVIRTLLIIYDDVHNPLALESFVNIGDEQQRNDFEALTVQDDILLLFYDQGLTHRLTKRVSHSAREGLLELLQRAQAFLRAIPPELADFDRAKADVVTSIPL